VVLFIIFCILSYKYDRNTVGDAIFFAPIAPIMMVDRRGSILLAILGFVMSVVALPVVIIPWAVLSLLCIAYEMIRNIAGV